MSKQKINTDLPSAKEAKRISSGKLQEKNDFAISMAANSIRSAIELGKFETYIDPEYSTAEVVMKFLGERGYECSREFRPTGGLFGGGYLIKVTW